MADTLAARLSLDDVRASVKRVQTEGRKFVSQLRKDASALAKRRPLDLVEDARKRATKAVRDLQALVVESLSGLADQAVSRAGLARAKEVSDLKRRVNELERRIERVTKAA